MKKFILFALLIAAAACAAAWLGMSKFEELNRPADLSKASPDVIYEVPDGAMLRGVSEDLEKRGLLRSAKVFEFIARRSERGGAIKTGKYRLNASMSPDEILEVLVSGKTASWTLTFPEGLTLKQCAAIVEKNQVGSAAEFLRITQKEGHKYGKIFPNSLEGYFFPDTYTLPLDCDVPELVKIASARFEEMALPYHTKNSPLSLKDTIILASLVEREAQVPSERPVIAGVYINRLRDGMKLECDATVQYALGVQKEFLLYKDLEIDSPYNTYKYPGLPAGPICSPGLASIKAACSPAHTEYYYYVRNDVKGDGSHVFGRNFREHQDNILRYQR